MTTPPIEIARQTYQFFCDNGQKQTALQMAKSLGEIFPNDPYVWDLVSRALYENKQNFSLAAELSMRVVHAFPDDSAPLFNAARCLNMAGHADKARELMIMFLQKNPDSIDALLELSLYEGMMGNHQKGFEILQMLEERFPHDRRIQFNMGWNFLRLGDMQKGLSCLAVGRDLYVWGSRELNIRGKIWQGEDPKNKVIMIVGEGGYGDEIISARFVPYLKSCGARVVLSCRDELKGVFSRIEGVDALIHPTMTNAVDFDYWIPGMDFASAAGFTYDTLPNAPYLSADPIYQKIWKKKLSRGWFGDNFGKRKLKIGLRWQGNPQFEHEQMRTPPHEFMLSLSQNTDFDFYSLQIGIGSERAQEYPHLNDFSDELKTWEDTAALISQLDLVITTCTSIAHMAGAMGKKTWVVVPALPYYIWAVPGVKSAWYPNTRVFRQVKYRKWEEPFEEIKTALNDLKNGRDYWKPSIHET